MAVHASAFVSERYVGQAVRCLKPISTPYVRAILRVDLDALVRRALNRHTPHTWGV
jgi:hypothetical protein